MTSGRRRLGEAHGSLVFVCLLLALVLVPIPLGSNRPYAWFAWEAAMYGLFAFWALGLLVSGHRPRWSTTSVTILTVLSVWLALVLLQSIPMPESVVAALNPVVHALQQNLALISVATQSTLSIDAANSYNEFLKYGAYLAVFTLTLATVVTRTRLLIIVGVIIMVGVLEALFGIYSYATGYVIFPESGAANELRAGTFVNRNHFANLLTMTLGLVFGLLTAIINARSEPGRLKFSLYSDQDTAMILLLLGAAMMIVAGIFVSGSRAPIVFFTIILGIMVVVARFGPRTSTGELVLVPVVLLGAAAVVLGMGFAESFVRLLDRDILGGERMVQNISSLHLLSAVWIAGTGAGNYQWMFPMFRGDDLRFVNYDHAHNDYLQTAVEQGIPVAAVLALGVALIVRELYRGYRLRRNPLIRGVIFGCLLSTGFMLLHALVEFNFRIPANAAYFFVIAAVGIAACRVERGRWRSRAATAESGATE